MKNYNKKDMNNKSRLVESFINEGETNLHYELIDAPKDFVRHLYNITGEKDTIYQIKATIDLPQHNIKKGDLGGFVTGTHNLRDNAWIYYTTEKYKDPHVLGQCAVLDYSYIGGESTIEGSVLVNCTSKIDGNVKITGIVDIFTSNVNGHCNINITTGIIEKTNISGSVNIDIDTHHIEISKLELQGNLYIDEDNAEEYGIFL